MSKRIEFIERYFHTTEEVVEKANNMGIEPEGEWKRRRIYVRLEDIFMPKEIPGKKNHCAIEFYDGTSIIIKGNFDTVCNLIDDRENQLGYEEGLED